MTMSSNSNTSSKSTDKKGYLSGLLGKTGDKDLTNHDDIVSVAAVIRSRYGVVFMSNGEGEKKRTFAKFTVNGSKDDPKKGFQVAVYVQKPTEGFKYVRYYVYVTNNKAGLTSTFKSLSAQQVLDLLTSLHAGYSFLYRLTSVDAVKEAPAAGDDQSQEADFDDDIPH